MKSQIFSQEKLMDLAVASIDKTRIVLSAKPAGSSPLQTVIQLYKEVDAGIASTVDGQPLQCSNGCDYCCHYRVMVYPLEVFAITEIVRTWSASRQAKLMSRLATHLNSLKDLTPKQHLLTNLPCVFLEDHSCSIYDLRPIACRSHHEAHSKATCKETFLNPASPATGAKLAAVQVVGDGAKVGIDQHQRSEGLDVHLYEFGAALHEALTSAGSLKRYRKGKLAFPSVKDRGELGNDNDL